MADIYECGHCGERKKSSTQYCDSCKTAGQRKAIDEENAKIKKENIAKGYAY